ncbi:hypothetical protein E5676_scaffold279G00010 [Cucumis melo var. makuwa]|uniref:Uncharacterized protein n=1 Tax=Cucumis melo var. makuwa TaxID=1194695 RepID=A0A5A7UUR1_CUCMM|nr:hypothetical protein E6C27_scaffold280G001200 [Cucumis melo var. makuwa]TYK27636.1 hypothetical protein E5676_scaffold279G00010 [Cucumis melo var. makuwa]
MPTRHDNTIPLEYAMMIYCIKKKMVVNLGAIIRNSILSLMEAPKDIMPFPFTIKALCLKAVPELSTFLQAPISDGVCFQATLNQTIMLHQNKEEERCIKTLNKVKGEEEEASSPPPPLKRKKSHDSVFSLQKKGKEMEARHDINPKPLAILPLTLPSPPAKSKSFDPPSPHLKTQPPPPNHTNILHLIT